MDADGYPEEYDIKAVEAWPYQDCTGLLAFVKSKHADIMDAIETSGNLDEATEKALTAAADEFKKTGVY